MYRAPTFLCQRHYCRTFHSWKHRHDLLQFIFRGIHQYIFLIFRRFHSIHTEQQLVQNFLFLIAHILITDQQRFRFHHHFHLFQAIADQSRTGADNIKNSISQPDTRSHLYRTGNDMYFRIHPFRFHVILQNHRIRGCNLLAIKPFHTGIIDILRHCQRQTAFTESETFDDFCVFPFFNKLILSHNSQISHTGSYRLRNIVIPQEQHFYGKIRRLYQQRTFSRTQFNV